MVWTITKKDIPFFGLGAKFLGSGGGGDPFTLCSLAQSVMSDTQEIEILPFSSLSPDERVVCVSSIGSSAICDEKMSTGEEGLLALDLYEETVGYKASALVALNVGGSNAMIPFIVAAQRGLPIVDGDGVGRTFPEIHLSSFHLMGIPAGPMVISNQHRRTQVFDHPDTLQVVHSARQQVHPMGGIVYTACFGMNGTAAKTAVIPNTLQLIYELGQTFMDPHDRQHCLERMNTLFANSVFGKPYPLIQGKVHAIRHWFVNGSIVGRFEIQGTERWDGQVVEVGFTNEYLSAKRGDQYLCMTPDLLLLLDEENLQPCLTDDLQEGLLVTLFGVPAPNLFRTGEMLELVGPRAFGIETDFVPVELAWEDGGTV